MEQNGAEEHGISTSRLYRAYKSGDPDSAKGLHPADRKEARTIMARLPATSSAARSNVEMLRRAVDAAGRDGIDQIIDIGCDLPIEGVPPLHDVLRAHHPQAQSVLIDHDTYVVTHATALLAGDAERTAVVEADAREPEQLLDAVRATGAIDFDRPACIVLGALLHFVGDDETGGRGADGVVSVLASAAAPGSWIVVTHGASDINAEAAKLGVELYRERGLDLHLRSRGDIERIMGPARLLDPGVVPAADWRPDLHTTPVPFEQAGGWVAAAVVG
ncbi:SAM-dependent methyltransferase [Nocardiopsis coralliicola]